MGYGAVPGGWCYRRSVPAAFGGIAGDTGGGLVHALGSGVLSARTADARLWVVTCRDLMVVGAIGLLLLPFVGTRWPAGWVGLDEVVPVLVSAAAACAATAAILAAVVHRLTPDPRAVWLSSAFTMYGAVSLPITAVAATWQTQGAVLDAVRFAGHLLVVLLLLVAAMPPVPRPVTGPMRMSAVAGLLVVLAGALAWLAPGVAAVVTGNGVARSVVGGVGLLGAFALVMAGLAQRSPMLARVGMGAGIIAVSHLVKIWAEHAQLDNGALVVAGVRLFGVLVVVLGLVHQARRAFGEVREVELQRQEELRLARMGLARAAERDHELRNGLAGLACATHLLDRTVDVDEEVVGLRAAMTSELGRLESMLAPDGRVARDPSPALSVGAGGGRPGDAAQLLGYGYPLRRRAMVVGRGIAGSAPAGAVQPAGQLCAARAGQSGAGAGIPARQPDPAAGLRLRPRPGRGLGTGRVRPGHP